MQADKAKPRFIRGFCFIRRLSALTLPACGTALIHFLSPHFGEMALSRLVMRVPGKYFVYLSHSRLRQGQD